MIRCQCPHCGAGFGARHEAAGKAGACPRCKGRVVIPNPSPDPDFDYVGHAPEPADSAPFWPSLRRRPGCLSRLLWAGCAIWTAGWFLYLWASLAWAAGEGGSGAGLAGIGLSVFCCFHVVVGYVVTRALHALLTGRPD